MAITTTTKLLLTLTLLLLTATLSLSHNITQILSTNPDLSQFNDYLTRTRLADEINSRQTVTVLALNNNAMTSLASGKPLSVIKNLLSLHVLLDYYDPQKLHSLPHGSVSATSLYQTTGAAAGNEGFVNITDAKGGVVAFSGSGQTGPKSGTPTYTKSVQQVPYNLSVVEISAPIVAPALLAAPAPSAGGVNVTGVLEKAGCKTFASLIASSGVLKVFQSQMDKGLTIFAPNDEAFKAKGLPDLSKLTNAELVSLLQYHALNTYAPTGTLKSTTSPLPTLATNGAGKFDLTVTTAGDSVTLHTGLASSRLASTILDSTPVTIFSVDSVLLPVELFGMAPSPAPSPAGLSPAPAPLAASPAPSMAPTATPMASPPSPPAETPVEGPAEGPAESDTGDDGHKKNDAAQVKVLMALVMSVASSVISLVL